MRVRLLLTALSLAIAIAAPAALAGCGGDDNQTASAGDTTSAGAGGQTVDVSETDFKLDPSEPTVEPGTVSFKVTNDGAVDHNLEVEGPEGEAELEQDLAPGESGTLTVDLSEPGKYEFYCPVGDHRERGMEGEVAVTAAGGAADSGAADSGGAAGGGSAGDSTGGGYGY